MAALFSPSLQQQPYFDFEFDEGEAAALPPASLDVAQCEAMMLEPTQQALELTVNSASSDDEQPQSTGKRKRGAAAEASGRNGARGLRRSVSFSTSSLIRMTEIVAESSSPVPVEHKTDHEARMRAEDGPRPAATLLDDLIVAFFERGAINGPDDVGLHLETSFPGRSGELPAVASRLETVVAKLDSDGGFVGLLPSNVRLGLEHKPHLSQLLSWLGAAAESCAAQKPSQDASKAAAAAACASSSMHANATVC